VTTTRLAPSLLAAALLVGACSGAGAAPPQTSGPTSTPTTTSSPTGSVSSTSGTSTTPARAATTTAPAAPRTTALLQKALIELTDLPPGFAKEPAQTGADVKPFSSKDPACTAFVAMANAANTPGSRASAHVSFSAGQGGPFVDESIDALASVGEVAALQATVTAAVASCGSVKMTLAGQGSSTMSVRAVSPPTSGVDPIAIRITASGGPLDGIEMTIVQVGISDTVLALTLDGAGGQDLQGATSLAVDKATTVLGGTASGSGA